MTTYMKSVLIFCFLICLGHNASTQTGYFSSSFWLRAPSESEFIGINWEELTDKQGLGFEYTNRLELAHLLDMENDRTTLYTGWVKWVPFNNQIEELTFFVLGKCIARFTYRNDRSIEMMEWINLNFMEEMWKANSLSSISKAMESIRTFVLNSKVASFEMLASEISITPEKNYPDNVIPLGYKVAYNEKGDIVEENVTGLNIQVFGMINPLKCYNHSELMQKSSDSCENGYVIITRDFKDNKKTMDLMITCSPKDIDLKIYHSSLVTYHKNGSIKTVGSLFFEAEELKRGSHMEYLESSHPSKQGVIRCKMDDINSKGIGDCSGNLKQEIKACNVRSISLLTQLTYNKFARIEDFNLDENKTIEFTPILELLISNDLKTSNEKDISSNEELSWDKVPEESSSNEIESTESKVYYYVDEDAEFPGGYAAMIKFLGYNLNYPESARENEIQGKCYVKFVVKSDGTISGVQVERGIAGCPECDNEAIRLVKMMPKWKPARTNGRPVSSIWRLPINFSLE